MNKLLVTFCVLLVIGHAFAQPPAGAPGSPPAGETAPGGAAPRGEANASGHLYGKLVDSSGRGIGHASVLILKVYKDSIGGKQKDVLLKGLTTQNNGDFSAEDLPLNIPLKLNASAVGYTALSLVTTLTRQSSDKDLGNLQLAPASCSHCAAGHDRSIPPKRKGKWEVSL